MRLLARSAVLSVAAALVIPGAAAHAQVAANWLSAVTGNWNDPTRWSTNPDFPNNGGTTYDVTINATGAAYSVTLNQDITVDSVMLDSPDLTLLLGPAFTLSTVGDWSVLNGATVDGQNLNGGIQAAGTTTFQNATLRNIQNFVATGPVVYTTTTTLALDDTDIDHGDGTALWGSGGDIELSNGSTITNGAASTFTISNSRQLRHSGAGGAGALTNLGIIVRDTDAGAAEVLGVALDNQGTLDVRSGTFRADNVANIAANQLTAGTYVFGGGSIDFTGATITTNAATVEVAPGAGTFTAFDSLTTNAPTGVIRVRTGRTYTKPGALTNDGQVGVQTGATLLIGAGLINTADVDLADTGAALTVTGSLQNSGLLTIGASSSASAAGMTNAASGTISLAAGATATLSGNTLNSGTVNLAAGSSFSVQPGFLLQNVSGSTLSGGTFNIAGTLKADNLAGIQTVASIVVLDGPGAGLVDGSNADVVPGVRTIASGGELANLNGRNITTTGDLTLTGSGRLRVGAGSAFTVGGTITNLASGTFSTGQLQVAGLLRFNGATIDTVDADIALDDAAADIVDENNNPALAALDTITPEGSFGISNGRNLALQAGLTTAGGLSVGVNSTLTAPGPIAQSAGEGGDAGGTIQANGGFTMTGGILQGSGTINGQTISDGRISPGASPGLITFGGSLDLGTGTVFDSEIGGLARGTQYDAVNIEAALNFNAASAGVFRVFIIDGFSPAIGDRFYVVRYEQRVGTFASHVGTTGLPGGLRMLVYYDVPSPFPNETGRYLMLEVVPTPGVLGLLGMGFLATTRRRR
jgi:hypothetical protein